MKQRSTSSGQRRSVVVVAALVLATLLGSAEMGEATHFRFGHLTWRPISGNTVEFRLQTVWRRNGYVCRSPITLGIVPCSSPDGLPGNGDVILETIGGTLLIVGDGSPPVGSPLGPLMLVVTAIEPAQNWLFAEALDPGALPVVKTGVSHTYAAAGNYTARIDSCCRISSALLGNFHVTNPDGFYKVDTLVNVGTGNSPPASSLPPIVVCPVDSPCAFFVPAGDVDGDPQVFRLSTSSEAAAVGVFNQPGPPFAPHAATIDADGLYEWDTTGAILGPPGSNTLYSTQVTLADLDSTGNVKSTSAIDFFIQLVPLVGEPPVFNTPPHIVCGATQHVPVGATVRIDIEALDEDLDDVVQLLAVGLPLGASMTPPLPILGNPVSSVLTWTPGDDQMGTTVIVFEARDQTGQQALCSQIINVVARHVEGRMTGGGTIAASDIGARGSAARVTHAFTLHCSPGQGPDILQVNWAGHRFHLEHVLSVGCFDNPSLRPHPPGADFDTLTGLGEGRLNGRPGATVEWELTDAGEPGRQDTARIVIRDRDGREVLSAAGTLAGGNHQSHAR